MNKVITNIGQYGKTKIPCSKKTRLHDMFSGLLQIKVFIITVITFLILSGSIKAQLPEIYNLAGDMQTINNDSLTVSIYFKVKNRENLSKIIVEIGVEQNSGAYIDEEFNASVQNNHFVLSNNNHTFEASTLTIGIFYKIPIQALSSVKWCTLSGVDNNNQEIGKKYFNLN